MRTTKLMAVVGLAMALGFSTTQAQSGAQGHVVMPAAEMKWGPAPPGLPPGAQLAVLSGDPGQAAPFMISAKFPDGYMVRPHWHPTAENLIVWIWDRLKTPLPCLARVTVFETCDARCEYEGG